MYKNKETQSTSLNDKLFNNLCKEYLNCYIGHYTIYYSSNLVHIQAIIINTLFQELIVLVVLHSYISDHMFFSHGLQKEKR